METITMSPNEFRKLLRETFIYVLTHRKDLIEEAVIEAMEDIGLGVAMEQGRTGEYIDRSAFTKKLEKRVKGTK
jgi:lipoate-protein ligase B